MYVCMYVCIRVFSTRIHRFTYYSAGMLFHYEAEVAHGNTHITKSSL